MIALQPQTKIDWPELYMVAEASREPFMDMRIVTAKSEFVMVNGDMAYTHRPSIEGIADYNKAVLNAMSINAIAVQERVTINEDGEITVVVNTDQVDDDATWAALDLVARAMDELDGESGTVQFGAPLTFTPSEIPWLVLH